jgi:hypothetical protein
MATTFRFPVRKGKPSTDNRSSNVSNPRRKEAAEPNEISVTIQELQFYIDNATMAAQDGAELRERIDSLDFSVKVNEKVHCLYTNESCTIPVITRFFYVVCPGH